MDANIWIYLFPPTISLSINRLPPRDQRAIREYSTALKKIASAKTRLILDPLILSEYLNRYCRIECNAIFKGKKINYKQCRESEQFHKVSSSALTYVKRIMSMCKLHSIPASELDINQALDDFSTSKIDFNDAVFVSICRKRNLKLMTHDSDFKDSGIDILTANKKTLD